MFSTAAKNTSIGSLLVFSLIISKAEYKISCAIDFFPSSIIWLINFVTTTELKTGSASTSRIGALFFLDILSSYLINFNYAY
ncbi:Hypothetical protein MCYN_0864 [Mycoplasmopsis cynos C142]|uniref:Uncharacterized protein n=1 Tax=Mycoplasmopsis cynos (strain C142) TaxID=1246955 RepID=L0RYI8_MYCC1|nr:Hypothetical protein MCYN_0864 [Mycoplasmopsis cynos C142]